MKKNLYLFLFFTISGILQMTAQVLPMAVSPVSPEASPFYYDLDRNAQPEPISCEEGGVRYYRMVIRDTLLLRSSFEKIETNRDKFNLDESEKFEARYNEENKEKLLKLQEEDLDIKSLHEHADFYFNELIEKEWFSNDYSICTPICVKGADACYSYHEWHEMDQASLKYEGSVREINLLITEPPVDNDISIVIDLVAIYEYRLYFMVSCKCLDDPDLISEDPVYTADIWDNVDLTSPRMKPSRKPFPWWIPVVGVAAVTTGTILILSDNGDDPDPGTPPVAIDDALTVNCGEGGMINPLANDSGSGISLVSFAGPAGLVTRDGNVLIISPDALQSFTITYTIINDEGLTASATIFVTVNILPFELAGQEFTLQALGSLSTNLLTNIGCSECTLINVDQNPGFAILSWQPNGQISITLNDSASGIITINYTVRNRCLLQDNATITIIIDEEPCDIQGNISTSPANCGLNNGSVNFIPQQTGISYQYFLNGELVILPIDAILAGEYTLRVQESGNEGCFADFTFSIESLPFTPGLISAVTPGNCYQSGSATFNYDPSVEIYGPGQINFSISGDGFETSYTPEQLVSFDVANIIEQQTGVSPVTGAITVIISPTGVLDECIHEIQITIPEEEVPFIVQDNNYQALPEIQIIRNVLTNDTGTAMQVVDFTPVDVPVFNIDQNGSMTFRANEEGTYQSTYIVRDTCGRELTGLITITVSGSAICNLSAQFETAPADCGISNGTAAILVFNDGEPIDASDVVLLWSNGSATPLNSSLPAGMFSVSVTIGMTTCTETFMGQIPENQLSDIVTLTPVSGNCLEGGDIILQTQITFPYSVEAILEGNLILSAENNQSPFNFSTLAAIQPGDYSIIISNSNAPDRCKVEISLTVEEEELALEVNDDEATILSGQTWTGNVLTNDSGTGLQVLSFTQPDTGNASVSSDGSAMYSAPLDFSGTVIFTYTVRDTCGQEATGTVTVTVNEQPCDFIATVQTTPANCGTNNGTATVSIDPPGMYVITWPDGSTSTTNSNMPTGPFMVIIMETGTGCTLELNGNIGELPNNYIQNIITGNSTCEGNGSAEVFLTFPVPLAITVVVSFEGSVILEIETTTGPLQLDAFITLFPGEYQLSVNGTGYPQSCEQNTTFVIEETPLPLQAVDDIVTTDQGDAVSGNVLLNDTGTNIQVTDFTLPSSGNITISPQGEFTYIPDPQFVGNVSIDYTITDVCGNTASAALTIEVVSAGCDYTATFNTTPADCGADNGTATIVIQPAGNYEIIWSNGVVGPSNTTLPAGSFFATVTEIGTTCSLEFFGVVDSQENEYVESATSSGSTCLGDGDIVLTLSDNPGFNPPYNMSVILNGETILNTTVPPGTLDLSDQILIFPGTYTIEVNGQGIPLSCLQSLIVIVPEIEFPLNVVDDFATTQINTPWTGNVLDNDTGEQLEVVSFTQVTGGNLQILANGAATFTPNPGFSGTVVSQYTVEDICGNQATGSLTIEVQGSLCDGVVVTAAITEADCGLVNGFAQLTAQPSTPPNQIMWSNGQSGPVLGPVLSGLYSATLTYPNFNCSVEFDVEIPSLPPFHIASINEIHEGCFTQGDAIIELVTNGPGPLHISILTPSGDMISFNQAPGTLTLSNIIIPVAGTYSITVNDVEAGINCTHTQVFTIIEYFEPMIELFSTTPPSAPGMDDGEITIIISGSNGPFIVLANGFEFGPFPGGLATLTGLPEGEYFVIALNVDGCPSNALEVFLFGAGLGSEAPYTSANLYTGNASQNIADVTMTTASNWLPGKSPYEQPVWPEMIAIHQVQQAHGGITFQRETGTAIHVSFGRTQGLIRGQFASLPDVTGQWSSTYAGMALQPHWKIGALRGSIQLGALGGLVSGHLSNDQMEFNLNQWLMMLQIAPVIQVPVNNSLRMEAGYDLQVDPFRKQAGSIVRLGISKIF